MSIRKVHITLGDVVTMLLEYRATESNPKNAAVQCPNNMKWIDINRVETSKQANILILSLSWKERISTQMAMAIRSCDKKKLDSTT